MGASKILQLLVISSSLCFSGVHAAPQAGGSTANPTVVIPSGTIIGTRTTIRNQPTATPAKSYLGIPFAAKPVRFAAPSPPAAWTGPLLAQAVKPACIQQFVGTGQTQASLKAYFNNPQGPAPAESEDCLYLNVYAPVAASSSNPKPVLFWIFGGNLQFGSGGLGYYDGSSFAVNQDVVVVTINYRTNIFGFPNSPDLPTGQKNPGYLDQRMALAWVTANIARFGGDPSKVTIFGESAGGESVKQLIATPPNPVPFRAAILESQQSAFIPGQGVVGYAAVVQKFCKGSTNVLACLRAVPGADLKAYIEPNLLFFPPVNGEGTSVADVRGQVFAGKAARVPILMGTNRDEGRVFITAFGLNPDGTVALDRLFNAFNVTNADDQKKMIDQYNGGVKDVPYVLASQILTDFAFTCPTSTLASFWSNAGYAVWRYRYNGVFPNVELFPNPGAYHTVEIPSVFGTYPATGATTQQIQLSQYMQTVWANFAKQPIFGAPWPRLGTASSYELGELGAGSSSGEDTISTVVADYPCPVYNPFIEAIGFAY